MKPYFRNPRKISKEQLEKLEKNIKLLGDLSGIVHNARTDEIISGHQRAKVIDVNKRKITIVEKNEKPDKVGTLELGYIEFEGQKISYRKVDWSEVAKKENTDVETLEARANMTANTMGGEFDEDVFLSLWKDVSINEDWDVPSVFDTPVFIDNAIDKATPTNNKYRTGAAMVHISLNLMQRKIDIPIEEAKPFLDDVEELAGRGENEIYDFFYAMYLTAKKTLNEILHSEALSK